MKSRVQATQEDGFTLVELLVSLLVLVPLMGALVSMFSTAANQHSSEQSSIEANQEARAGLDLMTLEIAQAGSHADRSTTASTTISPSVNVQNISVASSTGITVGDHVDVDTGAKFETVKITAVGTNSISGIFRVHHDTANAPIRLFALPYLTGIIPPAGLGAHSSATVTRLKFFGDMNGDGNMYYVEYDYDTANAQITRSMTPISQANKNPALPLVRNIKPNSVQFTLYTDGLGVVSSVSLSLTVQNTVSIASKYQETALSSRVVIPSAMSASALLSEIQIYGGPNHLPPTPSQVTTWASQ